MHDVFRRFPRSVIADMLENLLESVLEDPCLQQRFSDADRDTPTTRSGELTATDMDKLIDFVIDALPQDTHALQFMARKMPDHPQSPVRCCRTYLTSQYAALNLRA